MTDKKEINESLYSRQLYVLGHETMKRMAKTNVLVVGLGGLGVEVAKNLILTGVKSVSLYDPTLVTMPDLSSNFYLQYEDIGKRTRAEASLKSLAELNQYVQVNWIQKMTNTKEIFEDFTVAVLTDQRSLTDIIKVNQACREADCKFLLAEQRGLYGFVFADFGPEHIVTDTNGEQPSNHLISSIESGFPTKITVDESNRLNLDDGGNQADHADRITFTEIKGDEGMRAMNYFPPQRIKITGPYTLELVDVDSTKFGNHVMGSGYLHQVKPVVKMSFLPLDQSLESPEFLLTDFAKMDTIQLHLLMHATYDFAEKHDGNLPSPKDTDELIRLAKDFNANELEESHEVKENEIDEDLIKNLGRLTQGTLQPLVAALGGLVAQEVLKACSSKFTPIRQWCYLDVREYLASEKDNKYGAAPTDADLAPEGDRYDGLIAAIGRPTVQKLHDSSTFLVGAGAVGCEIIKNMVMMGLSAGKGKGMLHVTDMDTIETSNLSRQFLYRNKDVEKSKSDTAAAAVKQFNPSVRIQSYQDRVGPETEDTFNDAFFEGLDFVCNALDNIKARLYMDGQCVYYKKPLMESGTLGLKGNTQIVVPYVTESYGSSQDPPEKAIPQCLLHHFPNQIEHCIQWARDQFDGEFNITPTQVNAFLENPKSFLENLQQQTQISSSLEQLTTVLKAFETSPSSFEDCVTWARLQLESHYNHKIQQLLYNFPIDQVTASGTLFWSGPKRAPTPLGFETKAVKDLAIDFIMAASILRAEAYGINLKLNNTKDKQDLRDRVENFAKKVRIPDFTPQKAHYQINETDSNQDANQTENHQTEKREEYDDQKEFNRLADLLEKYKDHPKMNPIEFEKDDDTNWHMDFVTACSNMRASNYKIELADKHQTKLVAGKIIPAMITTTALVSGMICVEMLKILTHDRNKRTIEHYRNSFCNLALPFMTLSEPMPAAKTKIREGWEWSLWDNIETNQPMTLQEFIQYMSKTHQMEVDMISSGQSMIYSSFMNKQKKEERLSKEISSLISEISKTPLPKNKNHIILEISCTREEDDVEVPSVKYQFQKLV